MPEPSSFAFTTYYDERKNVLVNEVRVAAAYTPTEDSPAPAFQEYEAIWDTGATRTVITRRVVEDCNLKAIGMSRVRGVNDVRSAEAYLINIRLLNDVEFGNLRVIGNERLSGGADVLIGMDIIGAGDFAVSNYQGRTTFTFRCPSQERIDFLPPEERPPEYR
ncbi:MAG: retropepsin-like aspartic protease [Nitrospinae bacterium]|nr:retropepsin-like aspartic protease [Nitrospinota bacterium]